MMPGDHVTGAVELLCRGFGGSGPQQVTEAMRGLRGTKLPQENQDLLEGQIPDDQQHQQHQQQ